MPKWYNSNPWLLAYMWWLWPIPYDKVYTTNTSYFWHILGHSIQKLVWKERSKRSSKWPQLLRIGWQNTFWYLFVSCCNNVLDWIIKRGNIHYIRYYKAIVDAFLDKLTHYSNCTKGWNGNFTMLRNGPFCTKGLKLEIKVFAISLRWVMCNFANTFLDYIDNEANFVQT